MEWEALQNMIQLIKITAHLGVGGPGTPLDF